MTRKILLLEGLVAAAAAGGVSFVQLELQPNKNKVAVESSHENQSSAVPDGELPVITHFSFKIIIHLTFLKRYFWILNVSWNVIFKSLLCIEIPHGGPGPLEKENEFLRTQIDEMKKTMNYMVSQQNYLTSSLNEIKILKCNFKKLIYKFCKI